MNLKFELEKSYMRPVIKLDNIFRGCSALIDTGAVYPVWTKDVVLLQSLGAKLVKKNVQFSGFGGTALGDLYSYTLILQDKSGQAVNYIDMHIVAHKNESIPGYFLFSATMFEEFDYKISNSEKLLMISTMSNQVSYNFKIIDSKGNAHIMCNSIAGHEQDSLNMMKA